jgi:hypothetical protein
VALAQRLNPYRGNHNDNHNPEDNPMNRPRLAFTLFALALAGGALSTPIAAQDEPPEYRDRADSREAWRRGYERGFERGYEKGLAESRRAPVAAPAPPPPRIGPIHVTGATYGTSSRSCDATRWVASRANGRRSHSFEVTNDICGDPSRGDRKELEVAYRCGEIARTASAPEHRTLTLDCSL